MNPFDMVYDALFSMLASRPRIEELILLGNRISFQGDDRNNPVKDRVNSADVPEVILTSEGAGNLNLHNTSSSSRINRQYAFLIATGEFRLNKALNEIEWELIRALANWKAVLGALQWQDQYFVKKCDTTSSNQGLSDVERNRGIKGWSAIWRCDVEMHFKTESLLDGS